MKKLLVFILLFSIGSFAVTHSIRPVILEFEKGNYSPGEALSYRLHYGFINAGRANITVDENYHNILDKTCFRMTVYGWSTGMFNMGFRIRDTWMSYVDTTTYKPYKSFRNIEEGKYKLVEEVYYDYQALNARVFRKHPDREKEEHNIKVPDNVQDIVSGFYELRRINFNKLRIGDTISLKAFFDKQNYNFRVRYMGKVELKVDAGKFKAIKLVPVMPKNSLFDGEESIKAWISDDKNKIPLKAEAEMFIGSVVLELTSYKGLRNEANVIK